MRSLLFTLFALVLCMPLYGQTKVDNVGTPENPAVEAGQWKGHPNAFEQSLVDKVVQDCACDPDTVWVEHNLGNGCTRVGYYVTSLSAYVESHTICANGIIQLPVPKPK